MARHELNDDQWDCIESLFPKSAATGRPPADRRHVMNAILWIVRTGATCPTNSALGKPCITISTGGTRRAGWTRYSLN